VVSLRLVEMLTTALDPVNRLNRAARLEKRRLFDLFLKKGIYPSGAIHPSASGRCRLDKLTFGLKVLWKSGTPSALIVFQILEKFRE